MIKKKISLLPGKKVFFASDFHLGAPDKATSRQREEKIIDWLNQIRPETQELFIVGDVFDFWFEYKYLVPKGYVRFLAAIAQFTDNGIPVSFFLGNHDMWMKDYLKEEIGVEIYHDLLELKINQQTLLIGHGDGLGPGDGAYKLLKKVFRNRLMQWLFTRIHPNFSFAVANTWSSSSRKNNHRDRIEMGDKELLYQYCKQMEKSAHYDYYIFGHRHLPLEMDVNQSSKYINLGEWMNHYTFGRSDGKSFKLLSFN